MYPCLFVVCLIWRSDNLTVLYHPHGALCKSPLCPCALLNPINIVYNSTDLRGNCKILHAKTLYQLKKYISKFLIPLSTNTLLLWHWELSLPLVFNRHIRSIQKWQQEVFSSLLPTEDDAITSPSIVQLSCLFQNQENQDASGKYEPCYLLALKISNYDQNSKHRINNPKWSTTPLQQWSFVNV